MLPLLLSSIVIPAMALSFFAGLRAAYSKDGICKILLTGSLDLCILSIGIAGGVFQNFNTVTGSATYSVFVVLFELLLAMVITVITKRGPEMGIIIEWKRALLTLGIGLLAIGFPACLLISFARP
jgi:hypothetical protein